MVKGMCCRVMVRIMTIPVLLSITACSSGFVVTATSGMSPVAPVVTPVASTRLAAIGAGPPVTAATRTNGSLLQSKPAGFRAAAGGAALAGTGSAGYGGRVIKVAAVAPGPAGHAGSPAVQSVQMATVIESVHLRAGPGTNTASYGTLVPDTQVKVLAQQSDWYRVRSPRGTLGWLAAAYVALDTNAVPPDPAALAAAHPAVRIAERYVGSPYLWGGASPRGFDCSGFTQYVYRQLGIHLPRRARYQFDTSYGEPIGTLAGLAPGDLVFFERTTSEDGITHVGIFAGEGRMIAARTDQLGVRYVNVYEPFWQTRFVGGLRIAR